MTENQRIKEIRMAKGLTMEEFGKKIGVTRSTVSRLESGGISVTEKVRLAICREYSVTEEWLRNGKGQMFIDDDAVALLGDFFGDLSRDEDGAIKKRLVNALSKLSPDEWSIIADVAEKMAGGPK